MSHLLLAINSSANFVIYTWRGNEEPWCLLISLCLQGILSAVFCCVFWKHGDKDNIYLLSAVIPGVKIDENNLKCVNSGTPGAISDYLMWFWGTWQHWMVVDGSDCLRRPVAVPIISFCPLTAKIPSSACLGASPRLASAECFMALIFYLLSLGSLSSAANAHSCVTPTSASDRAILPSQYPRDHSFLGPSSPHSDATTSACVYPLPRILYSTQLKGKD